jgi:PAS domain S-box-containing protein
MIEYAKDGIILIDETGKITFWNRAAEEIFGFSAHEAVGKSIRILVPPERYPSFDEGRKRLFDNVKAQGGGVFRSRIAEMPTLRKDGTVFSTEMSMTILKVRDSWQGLAIIRDITERKKTENEILLQKERLRATLTASPDAIVIVDVQGNIVECNKATLKLFQYASIEEVLGKNSLEFIAPRVTWQSTKGIKSNYGR